MSEATRAISLNGRRTSLVEDRYPDGRPCWVASYLDLDGCTAYAATEDEALKQLELVRRAWEASDVRHTGDFPAIATTTATVHWQQTIVPTTLKISLKPNSGASAPLQTA